ncbi:HAMP domain-containing histidine kinase [Maribacter litopenaei]|uniref:histidine kinase n=1 Tax=Maribacter litopenaei TaxID=2976127 RepID=A0ABY5Y4I9_9FLAO|nr:HAMP domain-containing sensor histidine kinase [Maribacter litopenaei]UWX53937.1 HAMP domain-containing histidine kinase [Maribacter litopenaei]
MNGQTVKELQFLLTQQELTSKERVEILYTLSRELTYVDTIKSLEYAEEALQLSTELKDENGIAYSYRILSSIYAINDNYFMSMEYIHKALDIFEKRSDLEGMANCYISMGHIYRSLNNRRQEINYHKKSFDIFNDLDITERIGVTAHNLGESYYNNKEFIKAENLTRYAININDSILNLPVLSSCYKVMGLIKQKENQVDSAKYYFKSVLNISEELGKNSQKVATVEAMMQLATMAKTEGDLNLQFNYLEKTEAFCSKFNLDQSLLRVYRDLQTFYLDQNNPEKVKYYFGANNELAGSIQTIQLEDRNRLTESMTSIHRLNTVTEALEKENAAQASTILYRNISLIIIALFLVALFFVLRKLKHINKELLFQNDTIQKQKEELQELNATKNKFFSIVAHDLRSPLASLKSFSTVLVDYIDLLSKDEIFHMGKQLNDSVDNTLKMADNLIVRAKCQMNVIEDLRELISVKQIVEEVTRIFEGIAANKDVVLQTSIMGNPEFMGDKNQIEFVVRNLVNNAIKFTPKNGIVNISVTRTSRDIKIQVSDTGIGMSPNLENSYFRFKNQKEAMVRKVKREVDLV